MQKEKLNLVEILKDAPSGTEFYSTVYGDCTFNEVDNNSDDYPIRLVIVSNDGSEDHEYLTSDGRLFLDYDGECILFPSKENRSWEGWKYNALKEGDPVMVSVDGSEWAYACYINKCSVKLSFEDETSNWKYIVPAKDFDFENIESNIQKSVV